MVVVEDQESQECDEDGQGDGDGYEEGSEMERGLVSDVFQFGDEGFGCWKKDMFMLRRRNKCGFFGRIKAMPCVDGIVFSSLKIFENCCKIYFLGSTS